VRHPARQRDLLVNWDVAVAVEQLILWRDVKKSGMLFGACTAISLFFFITKMSLATFVCYAVGFTLIGCTAWARLGPAINKYGSRQRTASRDVIAHKRLGARHILLSLLSLVVAYTMPASPDDHIVIHRS
jgi:hypothetical protein